MSFKPMLVLSVLAFSSVAFADVEQRPTQEPGAVSVSPSKVSGETQKRKDEELDAARDRFMERMMNRAGRH